MRHWVPTYRSLLLLGLFLSVSTTAFGGERPTDETSPTNIATPDLRAAPKFESNEIYLLEQSLKAFRIVKTVNLSRRVYLKKTAMTGVPQHFMSNGFGKMDAPEAFLLSGSVVRGDRIGGTKERFYVLTADGKWRRTEGPESYFVQDDTKSGRQHERFPPSDDSGTDHLASTPATHMPN